MSPSAHRGSEPRRNQPVITHGGTILQQDQGGTILQQEWSQWQTAVVSTTDPDVLLVLGRSGGRSEEPSLLRRPERRLARVSSEARHQNRPYSGTESRELMARSDYQLASSVRGRPPLGGGASPAFGPIQVTSCPTTRAEVACALLSLVRDGIKLCCAPVTCLYAQ